MILSEAYLHLKPFEQISSRIFDIKPQIIESAYEIARKHYKVEVQIDFKYEEGSYKHWIVFAAAAFGFITGYGSFRSGLDYMVEDGRRINEAINSSVIDLLNAQDDNIYRMERRTKILGKIQRLVGELDHISLAGTNISNEEEIRINQIIHQLETTLLGIEDENDKRVLEANVNIILNDIFPSYTYQVTLPISTQVLIDYEASGSNLTLNPPREESSEE